jgi:hypothetical protein
VYCPRRFYRYVIRLTLSLVSWSSRHGFKSIFSWSTFCFHVSCPSTGQSSGLYSFFTHANMYLLHLILWKLKCLTFYKCIYNFKGNLDKASPNAGFVLLMFYHLYGGKVCTFDWKLFCDLMTYTSYQYLQFQSRREFENELYERFGSLVKMPLLKLDRWAIFFLYCFYR